MGSPGLNRDSGATAVVGDEIAKIAMDDFMAQLKKHGLLPVGNSQEEATHCVVAAAAARMKNLYQHVFETEVLPRVLSLISDDSQLPSHLASQDVAQSEERMMSPFMVVGDFQQPPRGLAASQASSGNLQAKRTSAQSSLSEPQPQPPQELAKSPHVDKIASNAAAMALGSTQVRHSADLSLGKKRTNLLQTYLSSQHNASSLQGPPFLAHPHLSAFGIPHRSHGSLIDRMLTADSMTSDYMNRSELSNVTDRQSVPHQLSANLPSAPYQALAMHLSSQSEQQAMANAEMYSSNSMHNSEMYNSNAMANAEMYNSNGMANAEMYNSNGMANAEMLNSHGSLIAGQDNMASALNSRSRESAAPSTFSTAQLMAALGSPDPQSLMPGLPYMDPVMFAAALGGTSGSAQPQQQHAQQMPVRFSHFPTAVLDRILDLTTAPSVLKLTDFDDKVVNKLTLLVERYGEPEGLVMLNKLAGRLKTKMMAMKNGPGYLDVAISSHLDVLMAHRYSPETTGNIQEYARLTLGSLVFEGLDKAVERNPWLHWEVLDEHFFYWFKPETSGKLEKYVRLTLGSLVFEDLGEAVERNPWLHWEVLDESIIHQLKKLPMDIASERLAEVSFRSFRHVDNVSGCIKSILSSRNQYVPLRPAS
eukprot:gene18917-25477_t